MGNIAKKNLIWKHFWTSFTFLSMSLVPPSNVTKMGHVAQVNFSQFSHLSSCYSSWYFCFSSHSKNGSIIDQWEVDPGRVTLEEEIDEGAFGKVFKGTLKGPSTLSFNSTFKASRTIKGNNMCTVAVKMLHGKYYFSVVQ